MNLSEKHRPSTWAEVVNQDRVVESLKTVLTREEIPVAFMFSGPKGCGKTTIVELIRKELGISDLNYNYYNTANTNVKAIREIIQSCAYKPHLNEKYKMYFFDEAHMLNKSEQNALLDVTERPPKHVIFCLCTTDPNQVLGTIRDRCSKYQIQSFTKVKLVGLLRSVCQKEGANFSPIIYRKIAECADGSARNALSILDQIIDLDDENKIIDTIFNASVSEAQVIDICRIMLEGKKEWSTIAQTLKGIKAEPEAIRRAILGYLTAVMLNRKQFDERLNGMINVLSDNSATMYSGMGGLVGLIGLCFSNYNV